MALFELINSLLYIVAIWMYWRKKKSIDTYFVLLSAYGFTAIMCLLYQNSGESSFHTSLLPYFYMFLCFMICFRPYKNMSIGESLYINENGLIKALMWIYIITGLFGIYYTLPDAMMILQAGEYSQLRNSLYAGDDMVLYHSQFERLCKNIFSYLGPFGIVMAFYQLIKPDKKLYLIFLLFGTWLGNTFLSATLVASRGIVAVLLLRVALIFVLFRPAMPQKLQKKFLSAIGMLCIPLFFYFMAVSISRFGESDASSSIFMYLGHAMQNLNENCIGAMHSFAYGKYAMSFFGPMFGFHFSPENFASLGYTGSTGFYTFLGAFYIDFGPIITVFYCILLSCIIAHFTNKRYKKFSDLIVIVYFASFFVNGVFVIGTGYALQWIMLWVVYRIVKFIE